MFQYSDRRIIAVNPNCPEDEIVCQAAECLRKGLLVVLPTETVYGLAADPERPDALESIYRVKGRPMEKEIPLLSDGIERVLAYGAVMNRIAFSLAERYWPGPLTLVLPTPRGNKAFRVPDHQVPLSLVRALDRVLAVTSANRSGELCALCVEDAYRMLPHPEIGLYLDGGRVRGGVPSTVVRVCENGLELLREGAIAFTDLQKAAGI